MKAYQLPSMSRTIQGHFNCPAGRTFDQMANVYRTAKCANRIAGNDSHNGMNIPLLVF